MLRKVLLLLFVVMFAFGCATTSLLNKEPMFKTSTVQMGMYIVHVHDMDNDGDPDTIVVYIKNGEGEKDLVEIVNRPLNEKEHAYVLKALKEQAKEKEAPAKE